MDISKAIIFGIIFWVGIYLQSAVAADQFGRLFTTPAQRQRLDELRKVDPGEQVKVDAQALLLEDVAKDNVEEIKKVPVNALTVHGLVYRSGGGSTAWINNSNTFEGGVASQYIDIGDIEADKVEIKIPSENKAVKLKVGQTFDPVSEDYRDIMQDSATTVIAIKPAAKQ